MKNASLSSKIPLLQLVILMATSITTRTNEACALIPSTPQQQTKRAIDSIRKAIRPNKEQQQQPRVRLYVDYLIPLPPETTDADIDPWPGGLKQQYPYACDIVQEILKGVVEQPTDACNSQVIDSNDCCGFFVQESKLDASNDVAAILFPGVDQLEQIKEIDNMVGPNRTLILFNKQFQRPQDFGPSLSLPSFFGQRNRNERSRAVEELVFEPYYSWGFALQELVCRGEDVKLMYETPYWTSSVICDEDQEVGRRELELLSPQKKRPTYQELEARIGEVLPEPLWMRKVGEAENKGFKFQREQKD